MDRILAIQVKQIGDLVLTVPALRVLRRAYPEARITLVVRQLCAPLAPLFPFVDNVLAHRPLRPNLRLLGLALPPRYDLSLDFSGTDRAFFCTLMGRARKRATFNKYSEGAMRKFLFNQPAKGQLADRHAADYHLALLSAAGIEDPGPEPLILTLPAHLGEELDRLLYDHNISEPYLVAHPGTAREEKYWDPERWAEVIARRLDLDTPRVILTGGNDPHESRHIREILDQLRPAHQERVTNLAGKLSLLQSAAVISRAQMVIGVDTAALHFASGFRRPTVALFGPTNPFQWGPRHESARVVMPGHHEPIGHHDFNPELPERPMSELLTEQVNRAIRSLQTEPLAV